MKRWASNKIKVDKIERERKKYIYIYINTCTCTQMDTLNSYKFECHFSHIKVCMTVIASYWWVENKNDHGLYNCFYTETTCENIVMGR